MVDEVEVWGDVKYEVRIGNIPHKGKLGAAWVNMNFLGSDGTVCFDKKELDKAYKDLGKDQKTGAGFFIEMVFVEKDKFVDEILEKAEGKIKSNDVKFDFF